jgi:hypothetical protein
MKSNLKLFLLLLLFISIPAKGQKTKSPAVFHSITYETGVNWLKEENLFPIVHRGWNNGLTYRYENRTENYHEIFISVKHSKLKAKPETEAVSQNAQIGISYCMGFNLAKGERVSYYIGYNLRYAIALVEFPVWDESRAYWATSLTSGISNRLFINIKPKQSCSFSWDFSPLGFYSRPAEVRLYAQEDWSFLGIMKTLNSNFKPGFANNVLLSNLRTEYRFHLKSDHYFALQYSLSYYRICTTNDKPQVNSINNFGICFGI